jgi:hypothetical protein
VRQLGLPKTAPLRFAAFGSQLRKRYLPIVWFTRPTMLQLQLFPVGTIIKKAL